MAGTSRRRFCAEACRGAVACAVFANAWPAQAAIRARGEPTRLPIVKGEAMGSTVRVTVASTPLATPGAIVRVVSNAGAFLVTRTDESSFIVLSSTCSHEACLITEADDKIYVCPCHGSRFDTSGNVITGPAELPLYRFDANVADDVLTIAL